MGKSNRVWTGDLEMLEHPSLLAFLGSSVTFLAVDWAGQEACERWEVCLGTWLDVPMGPYCVFLWTLGAEVPHPWEVLPSGCLRRDITDDAGPHRPGVHSCL